jgi:hypothetical protein
MLFHLDKLATSRNSYNGFHSYQTGRSSLEGYDKLVCARIHH